MQKRKRKPQKRSQRNDLNKTLRQTTGLVIAGAGLAAVAGVVRR